jgi:hypothetical protein
MEFTSPSALSLFDPVQKAATAERNVELED